MEPHFDFIPTGKERILFVDDDETIVISVRNMLQRLGYKVTTFTDGREALKVFFEKPSDFDLVITDHLMPQLMGQTMAQEMLRMRSDIPIILCTGNLDLVPDEMVKEWGLRGIIVKPFTVRECAELVRRALDQRGST
jgi:two-component system cell cycle sensor histidine kinase/response regulator CckA